LIRGLYKGINSSLFINVSSESVNSSMNDDPEWLKVRRGREGGEGGEEGEGGREERRGREGGKRRGGGGKRAMVSYKAECQAEWMKQECIHDLWDVPRSWYS
jgi:hypothetical protein